MERSLTLHQTNIGKKAIMAVSGVALVGFVIAHLLGNLQVFLGPDVLNQYAANLRHLGPVLLAMRIGLVVAVIAHVWSAFALISVNNSARSVGYQHSLRPQPNGSTYASRTMKWSGPIVLAYLGYHLVTLTWGHFFPSEHPFTHHNVYNNVVYSFQQPVVAIFYMIANALLALHLRHGVWSMFQSLGANHPRYNGLREKLATAIAAFIFIGNVGIPAAILAGAVQPTTKTYCFPELAETKGECDGFVPNTDGSKSDTGVE